MHSKSKGWILIGVLLAAALTATGVAQVATTQVADTIYHADGTAATGTAIISWPAFTTGAGDAIPSGSVSATIAAGGALSVQLVPNAGATPMGSYYTVVYHLDDGTVSRQYWVVPASAAAEKVSAIESTVLPITVAMQTVSKSYVDTAIAAAVMGHSLDSTPYVLKAGDTMTGPLLLPADPVSAAQAADKHYVDASVAALGGGLGQDAATPPQTQYAVPAYLLSPSGGLASLGASHLSVDPTGYNLSGYHANFTNLGVSASQADCTQVGGLFGGHSCLGLSATYATDSGAIEWGQVINYAAYGPGQNVGNDGTPNSRITTPFSIYDNIRNRGGNAANFISMFGSRVGDWGPWYAYDFSDGGVQAPSDEGMTVGGTYQGGESFGYFHGTVLTGGSGATTPTFNFTGGCGGLNLCNPTDGGILIDTQAVVASGYFTGPSVDVSTGAVPLKALPVSATLPITTAWGHAEGLSIPATADRNITAAQTIVLTMVTGSFSPGDHVCVEGVGLPYGGFDEQSIVTTFSSGTITLPLAYPYSAVAIFKGGPCGTYISFAANLTLSGYRTSYHAIASFTGSDLIYAVPSGAGLNGLIGAGLPVAGSEPETTNGSSDPSSAFQTFCGAEIIESLSSGNSPVQIDPNGCAWTVADTVESPHFPSQKVYGLFMQENQNMPNLSSEGMGGININLTGMGVAGYTQGYQVNNLNSNAWYTSDGGKLVPPGCAFCHSGTWLDSLQMAESPADSIIKVLSHIPGQTSYKIFDDDGSFGGNIRLDSTGFNFSTNVNATGGFNGPGANLTTQLAINNAQGAILLDLPPATGPAFSIDNTAANAPANSPQVALNAVGGGSGPSGGIDFYYNLHDSSANLVGGLIPYGDPAGPNIPGLVIDVNAFGGVLTHMIWADPGTYANHNPGLTLMNGTTDCATLICLGPNATVDSTGAVNAANFTDAALTPGTSPICPNGTGGAFTTVGCSGGGGGGVSQIVAGTNVTISPSGGTGAVTINAAGGGSYPQVTSLISGSGGANSAGLEILGAGGGGLPTYLASVIGQQSSFTDNTYYNGTAWTYTVNGGASGFRFPNAALVGGQFELNVCPIGTAGGTVAMDTTCVVASAQNSSSGNQMWVNSQSVFSSWPTSAAFVLNPSANWWVDFSGNQNMASGTVLGWNADTGLSRDSVGVVDVGNGTAGDKSGAIDATLYKGPATAPSGSCSAIGWEFTQDGHATFCNGSTWVTKI